MNFFYSYLNSKDRKEVFIEVLEGSYLPVEFLEIICQECNKICNYENTYKIRNKIDMMIVGLFGKNFNELNTAIAERKIQCVFIKLMMVK